MNSSKRLATLFLVIMVLVSTPRAMQQLRHSLDAAQERAGVAWWNLLLTPASSAAATSAGTAVETSGERAACPQAAAARPAPAAVADNALTAKSNARPVIAASATPAAKPKVEARTAQQRSEEVAAPVAGPLTASNNHPAANNPQGEWKFFVSPEPEAPRAPAEMVQPERLSRVIARLPQQERIRTRERIQSELASLSAHDAPSAPPEIRVLRDTDVNEFISSPEMNALMTVLAKKGFNVQFRMKKALDRNSLPRPPKARNIANKNGEPLPLSVSTGAE